MGLMDKVKELVGGHKDQANKGVDEAAKVVDEKTGGAHSSQVNMGAEKSKEEIDKLPES